MPCSNLQTQQVLGPEAVERRPLPARIRPPTGASAVFCRRPVQASACEAHSNTGEVMMMMVVKILNRSPQDPVPAASQTLLSASYAPYR